MSATRFFTIISLVAGLTAVGQIANTIYVPGMKMIAEDLLVDPGKVQAVMALYLLTYGGSQFIYGPLSDWFGRRPLVIIGLLIFSIGSGIAMFASNFTWLLIGSFIQGLGTGVGGVMCRTVMRDLYSGRQLHTASSYLSIILIVGPILAPLMGGLLSSVGGWRANFAFLLMLGVFMMFFEILYFPETNTFRRTSETRLRYAWQGYKRILRNLQFQGYIICLLVTFAGVSVFEAVGGLLFGSVLHFSPIGVSLLFIVPLPGYLIGSYFAARLNHIMSLNQLMKLGILFLTIGSLSMLLLWLMGFLNAWVIVIPTLFYFFGGGILFPTATAGALEPFGCAAGKAGALLGGIQNLGAALCTLASAMIPQRDQLVLAVILCLLTFLVGCAYFFLINGSREQKDVEILL